MAFTPLQFPVVPYETLNVSASGGTFAFYDGIGVSNTDDFSFNYADVPTFWTYNSNGTAVFQFVNGAVSATRFTGGNGSYPMSVSGSHFFIGRPTGYVSASGTLEYASDVFSIGTDYSAVFSYDTVAYSFTSGINPNAVIYDGAALKALLTMDMSSTSTGGAYVATIGAANVPTLKTVWNPSNYLSLFDNSFALSSIPDIDGIHTHFMIFAKGSSYYTIVDNAGNTIADYALSSADTTINELLSSEFKQTPYGFVPYSPFIPAIIPVIVPGANGSEPSIKVFQLNGVDSASQNFIANDVQLSSFANASTAYFITGNAPPDTQQVFLGAPPPPPVPQGYIYAQRVHLPSANARGLL